MIVRKNIYFKKLIYRSMLAFIANIYASNILYADQIVSNEESFEIIKTYKQSKDRQIKSIQEAEKIADSAIEMYTKSLSKSFTRNLSREDKYEWSFSYEENARSLVPGSGTIVVVSKSTGEATVYPTL